MTLPDLNIVQAKLPKNSQIFNLNRYLYVGGASAHLRKKESQQLGNSPNSVCLERIPLLMAIKETIESNLEAGYSVNTFKSLISDVRLFYQFLDEQKRPATLESLEKDYLDFVEHLFVRTHTRGATLSVDVAYMYAVHLSNLFGSILGIQGSAKLIHQTRLKYPKSSSKATGKVGEKQNLEQTVSFGSMLVDLINGLTQDSIHGPIPLHIPIRAGIVDDDLVTLRANTHSSTDELLKKPFNELNKVQRHHLKNARVKRLPVDKVSNFGRRSLINSRVGAELLVFITQTGMNLSTVINLRREHFKYKPIGSNYHVRAFKERRQGEVFFEIFKEYKTMLQKHLKFIDFFFPKSEWLFPFFKMDGTIHNNPNSTISSLRILCRTHGGPWIPPKLLRNTRVNYLLRRSGDSNLTAEIHQHGVSVLQQNYERPSQQRAMTEVTRFWNQHDLIKKGELMSSVLLGQCDGKPEALDQIPTSVVRPNCVTPSGCLWCKHSRDIDNEDYVWSLSSFRYLKTLEASLDTNPDVTPSDLIINQLSEKINWYRNSNNVRAAWVEESEIRIEEGDYHPNWSHLIEFLEKHDET